MSAPANSQTSTPLLIVIPVYRDLAATRQCIESVIASELPEDSSVLIVEDHSPEQDTRDYCREITDSTGFSLLVNDTNLGFVASANRGMQFREDADVILLNSDTFVSGDWATRMRRCAGSDERIGTVTPFSNNGTICSYPMFNYSNPLPPKWTAAQLDNAFSRANASLYAEIPTAVGFCMLIKRECLDATGYFDEEHFGQGYGEECDFSLRAGARGWKHVVAADVFVFHQGAASFAESSIDRKKAADDIIGKLHPQYHEMVTRFIERDPLQPLRNRVDTWRMEERAEDRLRVLEEHDRYRHKLTTGLREQLAKARKSAEAYRLQVLEEREEREKSLQLLEDCRRRFDQTDTALADTDAALAQAEQVVADLKQDIQALQLGIENEQRYAASLREKVELMERSRSWRYTRWLRRGA